MPPGESRGTEESGAEGLPSHDTRCQPSTAAGRVDGGEDSDLEACGVAGGEPQFGAKSQGRGGRGARSGDSPHFSQALETPTRSQKTTWLLSLPLWISLLHSAGASRAHTIRIALSVTRVCRLATVFPSPCNTATVLPPPWPVGSKLTSALAP